MVIQFLWRIVFYEYLNNALQPRGKRGEIGCHDVEAPQAAAIDLALPSYPLNPLIINNYSPKTK